MHLPLIQVSDGLACATFTINHLTSTGELAEASSARGGRLNAAGWKGLHISTKPLLLRRSSCLGHFCNQSGMVEKRGFSVTLFQRAKRLLKLSE